MSHHNIDESGSTTSSDHSENEDEYDEEEDEEDEEEYIESFARKDQFSSFYPSSKRPIEFTQPIIEVHLPSELTYHWGTLHPYDSNYSGIELFGDKIYIGKTGANRISLDSVNVEVSITFIRPGEAFLEITSAAGFVFIDEKPVRRGDRITLKNGNQIGFYFVKTYIYTLIFLEQPIQEQIEKLKNCKNSKIICQKENPIKKICIDEYQEIESKPIGDLCNAIIEKYGTIKFSKCSKEEQFLRKARNNEILKYIKSYEKEALIHSCKIPFQFPYLLKYSKVLSSLSRSTLVAGPKGSTKFLTRIIHAISDEFDVPILSVKFKELGQTVDAKSQKRKIFFERQHVKFIGKGKRQKDFTDEIELGTKGIILFVKDSKAAVNFEVGDTCVGCFVDIEYLGNINEDIPETDQRIIGKLDEIMDRYGPMIILIFDITSVSEHQQLLNDLKQFLKIFKFSDKQSVIFGTTTIPPIQQKIQQIQQFESSLCMIGMKEMRFVETGPINKPSKDLQKNLNIISRIFGNTITITEPTGELQRTWKIMIEDDNKISRISKNRSLIVVESIANDIKILQYPEEDMNEQFTQEQIEKAIGLAIQHATSHGLNPKNITKEQLSYGLNLVKIKKEVDIEQMDTDNEFEKKLLSDVIKSDDIGVPFDEIGALDDVKKILNETITLPLIRPELFYSKLTQGAKGVLLFGPPGTGKTMLAKAVATESKSNFINVSMSSLGSKWFGEAEKYVKALFTLATKLSPCVIFIDEVDALLGKRSCNEHEAVRKMKNEFMALWDGIKSKEMERVIVMAATNRPFDLDDAVLRRLSRRILVDLPNEQNRETILKKILRKEDVDKNINYSLIAHQTDGFSGSDLFSLCQIVAMKPIKDYLSNEIQSNKRNMNPQLRPINTNDFLEEVKKINPSVSKDSSTLNELRNWNLLYGEGSTTASKSLGYFL